MDDGTESRSADAVASSLEAGAHGEAVDRLEATQDAPADERKATLQSLRRLAEDDPATVAPVGAALAPFLGDDARPVRLTTAKLLVALAEPTPDAVVPVVPSLAERLGDDEEFYYVRARSAEALGYVALEHPDVVGEPDVLADLRVGLSFDEPEVREKLAKALACVALGDPGRLRHQVPRLAEHLDDEADLVRYHLATALVAVGCAFPGKLAGASEPLRRRLDDDEPHVRGRALEALGLAARAGEAGADLQASRVAELADAADDFVADRARFALGAVGDADAAGWSDEVGSLDGVGATTGDAVDAMRSPDAECPHCGGTLPPGGPPVCPRCGAPR